MTTEETAIICFLNGSPDAYVSRKEIARKAINRMVFEKNPHWVDAPLASLLERHVIERDEDGRYRIKKQEEEIPGEAGPG